MQILLTATAHQQLTTAAKAEDLAISKFCRRAIHTAVRVSPDLSVWITAELNKAVEGRNRPVAASLLQDDLDSLARLNPSLAPVVRAALAWFVHRHSLGWGWVNIYTRVWTPFAPSDFDGWQETKDKPDDTTPSNPKLYHGCQIGLSVPTDLLEAFDLRLARLPNRVTRKQAIRALATNHPVLPGAAGNFLGKSKAEILSFPKDLYQALRTTYGRGLAAHLRDVMASWVTDTDVWADPSGTWYAVFGQDAPETWPRVAVPPKGALLSLATTAAKSRPWAEKAAAASRTARKVYAKAPDPETLETILSVVDAKGGNAQWVLDAVRAYAGGAAEASAVRAYGASAST